MTFMSRNPHHWPYAPTGPNTKVLKPVVLGLDVGTTATRASIAFLDQEAPEPPEILLRPQSNSHQERYDAGDFPSAANLFSFDESPETCIGYVGDDPDQTPVKMYPYIARIKVMREIGSDPNGVHEKEYRSTIPQLQRFFYRLDRLDKDTQARVMAHARRVFLAHLRQIRSSSEDLAESRGWKIKQVAATIPPNWDRWTQHFYILFLKLTWTNLGNKAITLLYESEAIGHWLLCLDKKTQEQRPRRLILADFGGHTLSHNVFEINYREDDRAQFSFVSLSRFSNCMHGGSELHASSVKETIQKEIGRGQILVKKEDEPYLYRTLMDNYRLYHRSKVDGRGFTIRGWANDEPGNEPIAVSFLKDEALTLYDRCFSKPLARFETVLQKNAKLVKDAVVVLNGGTFSNGYILERTKEAINRVGYKYLPWTEAVSVEGRRSSTVAAGAAMALVRTISVEQFMKRAVFAVMVEKTAQREIPVIWNKNGSQKAQLTVTHQQGANVLIACCPLPPRDGTSMVPLSSTFEFELLGRKTMGSYTISLDYKSRDSRNDLPDRLIVTVEDDDAGNHEKPYTVEWPVYYDPGACVIFVDIDEIPSAENDDSQSAPKRARKKKNPKSHARWEKNQRDPGTLFWEGMEQPSLPLDTLRQFEDDEHALMENTSSMEVVDVDCESTSRAPGRKRANESAPGKSKKLKSSKASDISRVKQRKLAIPEGSEKRKGEQRGTTSLTRANTSIEITPQAATDSYAEVGFTGHSFSPVNTSSERSQTVSSNTQPSQEDPGPVAFPSRVGPDFAYSDLVPPLGVTQPPRAKKFKTASPRNRQAISSHDLNKQNRGTAVHYRHNSSGHDASGQDSTTYSPWFKQSTASDFARSREWNGQRSREQADGGNVRLSASTRPNATPSGERMARISGAPYAKMH